MGAIYPTRPSSSQFAQQMKETLQGKVLFRKNKGWILLNQGQGEKGAVRLTFRDITFLSYHYKQELLKKPEEALTVSQALNKMADGKTGKDNKRFILFRLISRICDSIKNFFAGYGLHTTPTLARKLSRELVTATGTPTGALPVPPLPSVSAPVGSVPLPSPASSVPGAMPLPIPPSTASISLPGSLPGTTHAPAALPLPPVTALASVPSTAFVPVNVPTAPASSVVVMTSAPVPTSAALPLPPVPAAPVSAPATAFVPVPLPTAPASSAAVTTPAAVPASAALPLPPLSAAPASASAAAFVPVSLPTVPASAALVPPPVLPVALPAPTTGALPLSTVPVPVLAPPVPVAVPSSAAGALPLPTLPTPGALTPPLPAAVPSSATGALPLPPTPVPPGSATPPASRKAGTATSALVGAPVYSETNPTLAELQRFKVDPQKSSLVLKRGMAEVIKEYEPPTAAKTLRMGSDIKYLTNFIKWLTDSERVNFDHPTVRVLMGAYLSNKDPGSCDKFFEWLSKTRYSTAGFLIFCLETLNQTDKLYTIRKVLELCKKIRKENQPPIGSDILATNPAIVTAIEKLLYDDPNTETKLDLLRWLTSFSEMTPEVVKRWIQTLIQRQAKRGSVIEMTDKAQARTVLIDAINDHPDWVRQYENEFAAQTVGTRAYNEEAAFIDYLASYGVIFQNLSTSNFVDQQLRQGKIPARSLLQRALDECNDFNMLKEWTLIYKANESGRGFGWVLHIDPNHEHLIKKLGANRAWMQQLEKDAAAGDAPSQEILVYSVERGKLQYAAQPFLQAVSHVLAQPDYIPNKQRIREWVQLPEFTLDHLKSWAMSLNGKKFSDRKLQAYIGTVTIELINKLNRRPDWKEELEKAYEGGDASLNELLTYLAYNGTLFSRFNLPPSEYRSVSIYDRKAAPKALSNLSNEKETYEKYRSNPTSCDEKTRSTLFIACGNFHSATDFALEDAIKHLTESEVIDLDHKLCSSIFPDIFYTAKIQAVEDTIAWLYNHPKPMKPQLFQACLEKLSERIKVKVETDAARLIAASMGIYTDRVRPQSAELPLDNPFIANLVANMIATRGNDPLVKRATLTLVDSPEYSLDLFKSWCRSCITANASILKAEDLLMGLISDLEFHSGWKQQLNDDPKETELVAFLKSRGVVFAAKA